MLKFGTTSVPLALTRPCQQILPNPVPGERRTEEEVILGALRSPYGQPPLRQRDLSGKRVCVVISDITRSWQRTDVYLPYILEELKAAGAQERDITLLCALGTHRKHTEAEKIALVGEDIYRRYRFVDHDCDDGANLTSIGRTSRGVEVEISRWAAQADFLLLCGAIVFHDMAGFGGGRKSIVPGIAGRRTIMGNHALSMNPLGAGIHPDARQNNRLTNPLSLDMEEAADLAAPDFLFNVIVDDGRITDAFAGDLREAFDAGCETLRGRFLVPIPRLFDGVIASAGGYPCDINFYQSVKALANACFASRPGGTIVLLCAAPEGLGNPDMAGLYGESRDLAHMERLLRADFSIGRFISFLAAADAKRFRVICVMDGSWFSGGENEADRKLLEKFGVEVTESLPQALALAAFPADAALCLMPDASKTLPWTEAARG